MSGSGGIDCGVSSLGGGSCDDESPNEWICAHHQSHATEMYRTRHIVLAGFSLLQPPRADDAPHVEPTRGCCVECPGCEHERRQNKPVAVSCHLQPPPLLFLRARSFSFGSHSLSHAHSVSFRQQGQAHRPSSSASHQFFAFHYSLSDPVFCLCFLFVKRVRWRRKCGTRKRLRLKNCRPRNESGFRSQPRKP